MVSWICLGDLSEEPQLRKPQFLAGTLYCGIQFAENFVVELCKAELASYLKGSQ